MDLSNLSHLRRNDDGVLVPISQSIAFQQALDVDYRAEDVDFTEGFSFHAEVEEMKI